MSRKCSSSYPDNESLPRESSRSSNHGAKALSDAFSSRKNEQQDALSRKYQSAAVLTGWDNQSKIIFKKNMEEIDVKISLFLIEGEVGFLSLALREMMTEIVKRSSKEIQMWFYESGIEGNLPSDWESFKKSLIELCTSKDI